MKHIISKELDLEEFKKKYQEIRIEFITKLVNAVEPYNNVKYLACDEEGSMFKWVFDEDTFRNEKYEGSLEDAKSFASNMINDGMEFAFMGCINNGILEVWLTTWEEEEECPVWPEGKNILFEEIHNGVAWE